MTAPVVVHFIETGIPGGAESFLVDLCVQQKAMGLRPMIAHFDHPYFLERCRVEGIENFPTPPRNLFKSVKTLPHFIHDFSRRLKAANTALLHSHLFGPIVGGSLTAAVARIPHVGTLHDIHMIEDVPARIHQLQLCTLIGSRLVAVSKQMESFYQSRLFFKKNSVSCIYNGAKLRACATITRQDLQISETDIIAVVVGRLVPLKRVQDAIAAIAAIPTTAITLLVVGTGPEREGLEATAHQLGVAGKVRFLGERNDVPAILQLGDIFMQCSETEGLSMSILEALLSGLPCIVSDVGGNSELVTQGVNGTLFKTGNIPQITQALNDLSTDATMRHTYASNARKTRDAFSLSKCTSEYMSLYASLNRKAFDTIQKQSPL